VNWDNLIHQFAQPGDLLVREDREPLVLGIRDVQRIGIHLQLCVEGFLNLKSADPHVGEGFSVSCDTQLTCSLNTDPWDLSVCLHVVVVVVVAYHVIEVNGGAAGGDCWCDVLDN